MNDPLIHIVLDENQSFSFNSNKKTIISGTKYIASTEVIGINGYPFSAYFGILFFDDKGNEIDRKILWLNDFSGSKKRFSVIFKASTDEAALAYRINSETPINSNCQYELLPVDDIIIYKVPNDVAENYDDLRNYSIHKI